MSKNVIITKWHGDNSGSNTDMSRMKQIKNIPCTNFKAVVIIISISIMGDVDKDFLLELYRSYLTNCTGKLSTRGLEVDKIHGWIIEKRSFFKKFNRKTFRTCMLSDRQLPKCLN